MKTIIFIFIMTLSSLVNSQTIQRQVISTSGSNEWTLGECVINSSKLNSTGFQQGDLEIKQVVVNLSKTVEFYVYPNPVINFLNIKVNSEQTWQINVIDLIGKNVLTKSFKNNIQLDFTSLKSSSYILRIRNNEGNLIVYNIIKK